MSAGVPLDFVPQDEAGWSRALADPWWRVCSGQLYKIMVKGDGEAEGHVEPFRPNAAQRDILARLHNRTIILKARQLGMTTLACILWLDHALFVPDQRCGIVAHKLDDAKAIFRDKIRFAYLNLPDALREAFLLAKDSADELLFAHNNSSVKVATSMRSGTIHRLHVSEMGKMDARDPIKSDEVITGSLPAVPTTGVAIIESTAEVAEGNFHALASGAQLRHDGGQPERPGVWAFRFYPWFTDAGYAIDPDGVEISAIDHEYFDTIEEQADTSISLAQRAWYVTKRDMELGGDREKMWREYPSTPEECWQKTTEGTFYGPQMARARAEGRIRRVPVVANVPVHTFWDIGAGDGTAIWFMQQVGFEPRFIDFYEAWSEPYDHFIRMLDSKGYVYGGMYLPHDATHDRQGEKLVESAQTILTRLRPAWDWRKVERVHDLQHGIQVTRARFQEAVFDADRCADGIAHLAAYRKKFNRVTGTYTSEPVKYDGHSEAADAFRQWAQGFKPQAASKPPPRRSRPRASAMTA